MHWDAQAECLNSTVARVRLVGARPGPVTALPPGCPRPPLVPVLSARGGRPAGFGALLAAAGTSGYPPRGWPSSRAWRQPHSARSRSPGPSGAAVFGAAVSGAFGAAVSGAFGAAVSGAFGGGALGLLAAAAGSGSHGGDSGLRLDCGGLRRGGYGDDLRCGSGHHGLRFARSGRGLGLALNGRGLGLAFGGLGLTDGRTGSQGFAVAGGAEAALGALFAAGAWLWPVAEEAAAPSLSAGPQRTAAGGQAIRRSCSRWPRRPPAWAAGP